jgi:hypothetical protein
LRQLLILSAVSCLILVALSVAGSRKAIATNSGYKSEVNTIVQDAPGSRCTRLRYKDVEKRKKAGGSRCGRSRPRDGEFLRNSPPTVAINPSTKILVFGCPGGTVSSTCNNEMKTSLSSNAADSDGDSLLYTYSSIGGRFTGDGPRVQWDLTGVNPGEYTANVEVDDGCGCIAFSSTSVSVEECSSCK